MSSFNFIHWYFIVFFLFSIQFNTLLCSSVLWLEAGLRIASACKNLQTCSLQWSTPRSLAFLDSSVTRKFKWHVPLLLDSVRFTDSRIVLLLSWHIAVVAMYMPFSARKCCVCRICPIELLISTRSSAELLVNFFVLMMYMWSLSQFSFICPCCDSSCLSVMRMSCPTTIVDCHLIQPWMLFPYCLWCASLVVYFLFIKIHMQFVFPNLCFYKGKVTLLS